MPDKNTRVLLLLLTLVHTNFTTLFIYSFTIILLLHIITI